MDLTSFTDTSKKTTSKKILDNSNVTITQIGDEIEFIFKTEKAIEKYQDYLFFSPTNAIITSSSQKAQEFFNLSIAEGVEGLMFKNLDAPYKPGLRTGAMAKVKETKEDIDVVILGAEHGRGKRAGFFSSFLVGVKDSSALDEKNLYLTIGKVSSGIKEIGTEGASLEKLTSLLKPLKLKEENGITYFEPKIIIQVKYQEIQKSQTYNSGYALRFPRIISLREDKILGEINTIDDIQRFA